jgi:hypothetical protein
MEDYKYKYLSSEGSETVKTGSGRLQSVVVGTTSAGAIKIFDSAGSGGSQIAELKASVVEGTYEFGCLFATGLHIENPIGSKITVVYR